MIGLTLKLIKYGIFSVVVLILGQWIQWNGRTLAEHVSMTTGRAKKVAQVESCLAVQSIEPTSCEDRVRETRAHPKPVQHISPSEREELRKVLAE